MLACGGHVLTDRLYFAHLCSPSENTMNLLFSVRTNSILCFIICLSDNCVLEIILLWSPGWPETQHLVASVSQVLDLDWRIHTHSLPWTTFKGTFLPQLKPQLNSSLWGRSSLTFHLFFLTSPCLMFYSTHFSLNLVTYVGFLSYVFLSHTLNGNFPRAEALPLIYCYFPWSWEKKAGI